MGLGTPPQVLRMIALGIDLFDCVLPTRVARNGLAFTPDGLDEPAGTSAIARMRGPIVEGLDNYTCREFLPGLRAASLTVAGEECWPEHS